MDTSWLLTQTTQSGDGHNESLFSLGNGYLGFRGFPLWRVPSYHCGIFINGFYETRPIHYEEDVFASAKIAQQIVDLPDARYLDITINNEPIKPITEAKTLNLKEGILTHIIETKEAAIEYETFLSMTKKNLGAVKLTITQKEQNAITIISSIVENDGPNKEHFDPRLSAHTPKLNQIDSSIHPTGFSASYQTENSKLTVYLTTYHQAQITPTSKTEDQFIYETRDEHIKLIKFFTYEESKEINKPRPDDYDYEYIMKEHKEAWSQFWQTSDVLVKDNPTLQQALRFNLFQLQQSTGKALAAKGLTGLGYEGHSFWDTEIYALPFFIHTNPPKARDLITYRIDLLPYAQERAKQLSQKGALFAWRTIYGPEASAYFPAGTAQYHINADIAYALYQYLDITQDYSILDDGGLDLLIETARFYLDLGFFNNKNQFVINEVTGPDEYTALVNNNAYTNMMVKHHFQRLRELLIQRNKENLLTKDEHDQLNQAIEQMFIPYDSEEGIIPQDDSFLDKPEWDEEKMGRLKRPMLLHYHPLVIYRHRLLKQADTILAHFLLSDENPWYQKRRDFLFYEPLTTGDSSLSACIQAIVAFELGQIEIATAYVEETTLTDIQDLHSNTKDGLHTAAMAGSWMTIIYGVAGYRYTENTPTFRPLLPHGWAGVGFSLAIGDVILRVDITHTETTYSSNKSITIKHRSNEIRVTPKPISIPTKPTCKAVIFDLDGVITSTDEYHYQAWKTIADKNNLTFNRTINEELRGVSRRESLKIILKYNKKELSEEAQKKLSDEKNEMYRSSLTELSEQDILPNSKNLLIQLRERGIKIALASASENARTILKNINLTDYFDAIVDAKDLIKPKPDPEIFVRAANLLGLYPEECTGVEDAQAGIEAIKEAMMKPVFIDKEHPTEKLTIEELLF